MATLAAVVTECRMETTKVEFALHRLLFNAIHRNEAGMVESIGQARAALQAEDRRLRQVERHLRRRLELAGKAVA